MDYELRKDYFAKVLCEKKEIPDNCCKGSCALNKEIKSQEERENRQPSSVLSKYEPFPIELSSSDCLYSLQNICVCYIFPESRIARGFLVDVFRPPLS